MKKLVVCFDGTWNKPGDKSDGKDSSTNVIRLFQSIVGTDARHATGSEQVIKW